MSFKSSVKAYEQFHGRKPRNFRRTRFHDPKNLTWLGYAHAVEYVSNKINGGGDGTWAIYRHRFKMGAELFMDERKRRQLYIVGDKIKVTDRGIEN